MNSRLITFSYAVVGVALAALPASAQRRGGFAAGSAIRSGAPMSHGGGGLRSRLVLRGGPRYFGGPAYFPYFYSDYDYDSGAIEAPPAEIIEQQAAEPAAPPAPPADALVIELQGDHWVRITNSGESQIGGEPSPANSQQASNGPFGMPAAISRKADAAQPPSEIPSAVLVFRDGHQEEIGKYVISDATIYASADYWSSGSWTRKVQIAELDVPATLKLNQERGARFSLPSGPGEVMIRP